MGWFSYIVLAMRNREICWLARLLHEQNKDHAISASATNVRDRSFGAALLRLAQDNPSPRRKANPEQARYCRARRSPLGGYCTITPAISGLAVFLMFSSSLHAIDLDEFDRESYEEPAGASFQLLANPQDNIYGAAFGDGTWLKNTPVFGDFSLSMTYNGREEAWYSSIGMTIRLMPHWRVAPFAGAGGSYNYSLSSQDDSTTRTKEYEDQGESYVGGHAEAGIRFLSGNGVMLFEIMGRYTLTSLKDERNYWLAGISVGAGFGSN